MSENTKQDVTR